MISFPFIALAILLLCNVPHSLCTKCTVFINEININGPNSRLVAHDGEFVELKSDCAGTGQRWALRDYKLVMWKGDRKSSVPAEVEYIMDLDKHSFAPDSPYFLIASPVLYERLRIANHTGEMVSSAEFFPKTPKKNVHEAGFLNNGKERTMGLAVYREGVVLSVGDLLTPETAFLEKLDDILLYHEHGSGQQFADVFYKGYSLPGIEAVRFGLFLKDVAPKKENQSEPEVDNALSYCCEERMAKWPLGFKRTVQTPGNANQCEHGTYVLDGNIGHWITKDRRCDPEALQHLFNSPEVKAWKTAHAKKHKGGGAEAQALLGIDPAQTLDSLERQVSLLASTLGGLVSVGGIVGLVFGTVYIRRRRRASRNGRMSMGAMLTSPHVMDDDDVQ